MAAVKKKTIATQVNLDLLNRPILSNKAVSCNLREGIKLKRTIGVQCQGLKTPENSVKSQSGGDDVMASSDIRQKLALKIRAGQTKTTKEVQCNLKTETISSWTQSVPSMKSKSVQVGRDVSKMERLSKASQCDGLTDSAKGTCIETAVYVLTSTKEFHGLKHRIETRKDNDFLIVTRAGSFGDTGIPVDPTSITLDRKGCLAQHTLYRPSESHQLLENSLFDVGQFCDLVRKLADDRYKFCTGVPESCVTESNKGRVQLFAHPYVRFQSPKCQVMYLHDEQSDSEGKPVKCTFQCINCKYAAKYLAQVNRRSKFVTPSKKLKRILASSNYSINKLTPSSKQKRLKRVKQRRKTLSQRVKKLEKRIHENDVQLNQKQSKELREIVETINGKHKRELETLINSSENANVKQVLKEHWDRDSKERHILDTADFYKDQLQNENGDRGNSWSPITYRIALAVYSRSTSAYAALKHFNILNLPSIRSLQKKSQQYLDPSGINTEYLHAQAEQYTKFKEERKNRGEPVPGNVGVLIFDEVKVIDKIAWNSKNHEFVGLAMSPEDFPYLFDIFSDVAANGDVPRPANYILQFLWRDLTSNFDVMGPYFMCHSSLEHKFILGCLMETIRNFEAVHFQIKCIVCDGASENLALIKLTMGHKGVFGFNLNIDGTKDFSINPSFTNPCRRSSKIYWVICPSHQMKNMVSALHSSRESGPKDFIRNGAAFGWDDVKKVKQRDNERFENGQIKYARGLLQSYIERDAWTKLNVKPSKIMQQEDVLSELFDHGNSQEIDAASAFECYRYLRAVNYMFEQGFFSKISVTGIQSDQMKNILKGYKFFEDWIREILHNNPDFNPNKATQSKFLSWQTWDLLRVSVFGIKGLVEDFCTAYPGHYLTLSRINGSAVETLFSQFKFATGSKLSSTNYATARMSVLTKTNVHGRKFINRDYRDVPLYIRDHNI